MVKVDLHVHTKFSDGLLSVDQILQEAKKLNISEIAITDHDTIIHLREYDLWKKSYQLEIIPGIEFSTSTPGMHILGYGITNFDSIEDKMLELRKYNEIQNMKTIDVLNKQGISISLEDVKKIATFDSITYRDIAYYLFINHYVDNMHDVYKKYIGKGAIAYFPSQSLSMEEVLELIDNNNGISVLAHPFTLSKDTDYNKLISYMKILGLVGIETISPVHTNQQYLYLKDIIKQYDLIETGGTDFHDPKLDNLGIEIPKNIIMQFNQKILNKKK